MNSCTTIDDDCIDIEIAQKFEQERNNGVIVTLSSDVSSQYLKLSAHVTPENRDYKEVGFIWIIFNTMPEKLFLSLDNYSNKQTAILDEGIFSIKIKCASSPLCTCVRAYVIDNDDNVFYSTIVGHQRL